MAERRRWNAYDGDSLRTQRGADHSTNRVIGGNAPEVGTLRSDQSTAAMQQALGSGAEVRQSGERDVYGRDLVYVEDGQGDVTEDLIRRGLATPSGENTHLPHQERYEQIVHGEQTRPEWDDLAAEAEDQEMDFYRTRFDEVMRQTRQTPVDRSTPSENHEGIGGATGRAWDRGKTNLSASLSGLAEVMGSVTGVDALQEYGEDGMYRSMIDAARNPARVESYEDIDGLESLGMYVTETLAENAPQLAMDVGLAAASGGTAAVGRRAAMAGVGKAAMRRLGGAKATGSAGQVGREAMRRKTGERGLVRDALTNRGGKAGAAASIEGQYVGDVRNRQYQQELQNEDGALAHAMGVGTLKAGLEYAGFQRILGNVFRGADSGTQRTIAGLVKGNRDSRGFYHNLKRVTQLTADSGMAQGMVEAGQSLIDQMSMAGLDPDETMNLMDVDPSQVLDASLRGGIFGGGATLPGATATSVSDHFSSVREGQEERAVLDGQIPERDEDLQAQARSKDRIWLNRNQTPDQREAVRETMAERGAVREREGEDGVLFSLRGEDPLVDAEEAPTREQFLAERGQTTAMDTDGDIGTAFIEDAQGHRIEERAVTDDTLEQTADALTAQIEDLGLEGARINLEHPRQTAEHRASVPEQQPDTGETDTQPPEAETPQVTPESLPEPAQSMPDDGQMLSVRGEDGALRPPGELMQAYNEGRIDSQELAEEAQKLGVDPTRYEQGKQAPVDRSRLRNRLRKLFQNNVAAGRQVSGQRTGTRFQVADQALEQLDNAQNPDRAYVEAMQQHFGDEPLPRRRQIKQDGEDAKRSRRELVSRLKTQALQASDGRLNAVSQSLGLDVDAERLRELLDPTDATLTDQATDAGLIALAEEFNVRGMEQLTESRRGDTFDLSGMVGEMSQRDTQVQAQREETRLDQSALGEATREFTEQDAVPPMQMVLEHLDFLFDGSGLPVRTDELIEVEGGLANALERVDAGMRDALGTVPEIADDLAAVLDVQQLRELSNRTGPDAQRRRLRMIVEGWQQVLDEAALADMSMHTPFTEQFQHQQGVRTLRVWPSSVLEPFSEQFQQRQVNRELMTHSASQDINTLSQALDALNRMDGFAPVYAEMQGELSLESLTNTYLERLRNIHGSDMLTEADLTDLRSVRQVEGLQQEGERIIRRQLNRWAETFPEHLGTHDARMEAFAEIMGEVIQDRPTDPAGAAVELLMGAGIIGPGAAFSELQNAHDTVMDAPDQETARASTSSQRGQQSLGEDATSAQELSEQQMSDIIFKKSFTTSAFRFRGHDFFAGKANRPRVVSGPSETRRYTPKNTGQQDQVHPDNRRLSESHDVFVLDFETYFDDGYNMQSVGQDYQAFVNDPRFEATVLTVRDPNTGEVELIEGQQAIESYMESFNQRDSDRPVAFVAHNAAFDAAVAGKLSNFQPGMWLDTKQLAGQLEQFQGSLSLSNIGERFGLQNRKQHRSALEDTKGVRDFSALSEQQRQVFADYAQADTLAAAELFDIVEEATPLSGLEVNDLQTRLTSNPELARENPEMLARLAETQGFTTRTNLREGNVGEIGRSMDHTRRAGGQNLLQVPIRQSIGEGDSRRERAESNFVDAISFAQYHRSGEQRPNNPIEALSNLQANLARLAQGPESDISWGLAGQEIRTVPDETVIWLDGETLVTAGQAREMEQQMRDSAEQVRHQHEVRENAQIELEVLDHHLDSVLDQLADFHERGGNTDIADAVRLFQASGYGDIRQLKQQANRLRAEILRQRSDGVQLLQDQPLTPRSHTESLQALNAIHGALQSGDAPRLARRSRSLRRGMFQRSDRALNRNRRSVQGLEQQLDETLNRMGAIDNARKRIEQETRRLTGQGVQAIVLPDGANATIRDLSNRRFELLGRIGQASEFINRNRGDLQTSQRRLQHEADAPLNIGDQVDRATDSGGEVAESIPADDQGVDAGQGTDSFTAEAELREEMLSSGRGIFQEQEGAEQLDMTTDHDGNEIAQAADSMEGDIGSSQEIQPAQLHNDPRHTAGERMASSGQPLFGQGQTLQRLGAAADSQQFASLQNMARRVLRQMGLSHVNVALIRTNDEVGLFQARQLAETDGQRQVLEELSDKPGYANINGQVVISMDAFDPNVEPAQNYLTFAHELGHMVYDMHWHLAPEPVKQRVIRAFLEQVEAQTLDEALYDETTGMPAFKEWYDMHGHLEQVEAQTLDEAIYNGTTGISAFKEWYADQMGSHLVEQSTRTNRREFMGFDLNELQQTEEAQSFDRAGDLQRFFRDALGKLRTLWDRIQDGSLNAGLARFTKNRKFSSYANRVLRGQTPLQHRHEFTPEALHFTPDTAETPPAPKRGVSANANRAVRDPARFKPNGLWRSTINRIKGYHSRLAGMLFQQSQTAQEGGGSYENKHFTLEGRWAQWMEQAIDRMGGRRLGRKELVNQAYTDLRDGVDSQGARELRRLIDNVLADARRDGWRDPGLGENFIPRVFNHQAVQANRGELVQRARQQMPETDPADIDAMVDRIIEGSGMAELSTMDLTGPGNPVGMHRDARELMDAVGQDWLAENGMLIDEGAGAVRHMISGLSKRAAWESVFGKETVDTRDMTAEQAAQARRVYRDTGEGRLRYDPSGRYREMLEEVRQEYGDRAVAEINDLVGGALGHKNTGVNPKWRQAQEWMIGLTNLMILGFSGVATIPELGLSMSRANMGVSDVIRSLGSYSEGRRLAKDLGIAMTTGAEEMQRLTAGEGYQSGLLTKAQSVFFTLNGQNAITRFSRTMSTTIGHRFLLKAASEGDAASLNRLGLDAATVRRWEQAGRPAMSAELEGQPAQDARRVSEALMQFVNESSLHPSKFQATGWGNNPYFKVAWYLKQFLWTFGDTIIGGLARNTKNTYGEARRQGYDRGMAGAMSMMPATMAAAYTMPLALMSLGIRGFLGGDDRFDKDPDELTWEVVRKSGAFAQWDLAAGMWDAYHWDNPNDSLGERTTQYAGSLVPPVSQMDRLLHFKDDSWEPDLQASGEALKSSAPLINQWRGTWQWLFE